MNMTMTGICIIPFTIHIFPSGPDFGLQILLGKKKKKKKKENVFLYHTYDIQR